MLTVLSAGLTGIGNGTGVMFEMDSVNGTGEILPSGGWTLLTAVTLMLFSLLYNPCPTTIYKETKSVKWTMISTLLPIVMGFMICLLTTQVWILLH